MMTFNEAALLEQAFWLLNQSDDNFFWGSLSDVQAAYAITGRDIDKPFNRVFAGVIH